MGMNPSGRTQPIGSALFGTTRQAVLRLLFSQIDRRFYHQQIIRTLGRGSGGVQRELGQLVRAGIVVRTVEGRQTYFQVNQDCPVFHELRGLARKTFGLTQVLCEALEPIRDKICLAFLFGSIAAGNERVDSDVDVMLVGDGVSMLDAVTAFAGAQRELGREINPSAYGVQEFCLKLAEGQHFLRQVVDHPKIFLFGDEDELSRLARIQLGGKAPVKPARNRRSARGRR